MKLDGKKVILFTVFSLLLFVFQNCGAQLEELESPLAENTDEESTTPLAHNLSGNVVSFPLPGSSPASATTTGNINLGGGSNTGNGVFYGETGGTGSGTPGTYIPYTDNYRTSSLYPVAPGGSSAFSKHRYYFASHEYLPEGKLLWNSYKSAIAAWSGQQMGTQEREKLIVISLKKLSEAKNITTYGLTGTSLCYRFSGTVTMPTASQRLYHSYSWSRDTDYHDSYTGHKVTLSAINIYKKAEDELTQLEASGCTALSSRDKKALNSLVSLMKNYIGWEPSGNDFYLRAIGHGARFTRQYVFKKF